MKTSAAEEAGSKGAAIYREMCLHCHGQKGEGTEDYPQPLAGDRSIGELAKLIAKTMPEDDPGTCTGEDAQQVAAYIHEAFYSPTAQFRNKPARIELSRLTVRQYRNVVADLVGSFRSSPTWGRERGLKGSYGQKGGRRGRAGDGGTTRIDPQVNFDFGEASPIPEKLKPEEFSIRWEGSVFAPDTGDYEFIVKTEHSTRLYVNGDDRALIDANVKSGNDTEYRGTIRLLGGRAYPLKLEFSKGKQGVDDSDKNKPKSVPASIVLAWKRPSHTEEVIPERSLSPERFPELFVLATPFPPDDRSVGYERGTAISKEWDQATTDAAIETAAYVAEHLDRLAGTRDGEDDREQKLHDFCRRFAERAFRRPLTDELAQSLIDAQFGEAKDTDLAVKRVILLTLKSPRFLFRELSENPDAYDIASRLSFGLWDSLPDTQLTAAAAKDLLATREQIAEQAQRMAGDLRAQSKLRDFFLQWLKIDQVPDLSKDPHQFAEFGPEVASDLRTSLELFLDETIAGEKADFRELLTAEGLYLNGRLAKFYGAELPPEAPFQKVAAKDGVRSGLLTHPYLLAGFAYTSTSSPIHRGVFVSRSLLGRTLRPPPEAVAPLAPDLHADLTTRERVLLQTKAEACQRCHDMINPLGFPLENYDAIGRFRSEEKGKPIDPRGQYHTREGQEVNFAGPKELATFLAGSEEAHTAFVEHLFHNLVKQPIRAYGDSTPAELRASFAASQYNVRQLAVDIVTKAASTGMAK